MRVVILLDRSFAKREREMLSRLEIGLADEGIRVIHAVPMAIVESETFGLYSSKASYDDRGFPTTNSARVKQLVSSIRTLTESVPSPEVDVVHSLGTACERLAVNLAAALNAAPLLEIWQASSIRSVSEAMRHSRVPVSLAFSDPDLRTVMKKLNQSIVGADTPWGVHPRPRDETQPVDGNSAPSVALLADGTHPAILNTALAGLAEATADFPELLIFVDTERAGSARLWKQARAHGLLERLSIVPGIEARREPTLRLDALLVPEPSGRLRSLVLDAMARGIPVVATRDPALGVLSDPQRVRLVAPGPASHWAAAVRDMLHNGPARRSVTDAAQTYVRTQRSASGHVAAVLKAYEGANRTRHLPAKV